MTDPPGGPSVSEFAFDLLADSAPLSPVNPRRAAGSSRPDPSGEPVARKEASEITDEWIAETVARAEEQTAEMLTRPLRREALLTPAGPTRRRCTDCGWEETSDERDCSRCGSERLQEVER